MPDQLREDVALAALHEYLSLRNPKLRPHMDKILSSAEWVCVDILQNRIEGESTPFGPNDHWRVEIERLRQLLTDKAVLGDLGEMEFADPEWT
ncbi:MAG: hypothetical protein HEQ23_09920 [Tepidisphaera sp.]